MANPRLIIQLPRGGAVDRQLSAQAPQSASNNSKKREPSSAA
jgi:hypothetical protein